MDLPSKVAGVSSLNSRKGSGTTAELWLPVAKTSAQPVAPAQAAPAKAYRPLTVLAVDDDALVLMNTVAMLEDLGHTVFEAYSGQRSARNSWARGFRRSYRDRSGHAENDRDRTCQDCQKRMAGYPRPARDRLCRPSARGRYRLAEGYEAIHAARPRRGDRADESAAPKTGARCFTAPSIRPAKLGPVIFSNAFHSDVFRFADVRFGSKADMCGAKSHVRFTPKSGHPPPPDRSQGTVKREGGCGDGATATLKYISVRAFRALFPRQDRHGVRRGVAQCVRHT